MVRRKKSNAEELSANISEQYVRMDIDIQALREKNKNLVQSVAKLQKEKAMIQKQLNEMQEEYFKLNSKYVNLKSIFSTIDNTTRLTVPKMTDGVKHLAKIMQLCAVGTAVCGLNKEPQTLTVKPHMVNGTIINNPTITLSRFNYLDSPNNSEQPSITPQRQSRSDDQVPSHATPPRTSVDLNESFSSFFNNSNNENNGVTGIVNDNVSQDRRRNTLSENDEMEDVQEENDEFGVEDGEASDQDYWPRLRTITEESEENNSTNSSETLTDRPQENRICLHPVPVEHTKNIDNSSVSVVERTSSLTAEASESISDDTLLNDFYESPSRRMPILNSSIDISLPSPSESRFDNFENTNMEMQNVNQASSSFADNISSIVNEHSLEVDGLSNKNLSKNEDEKIAAMQRLGLMEKTREEMTTSTPVQNQRKSRRVNDKSQTNTKIKRSNVTKRKGSGAKVPQIIIQRLSLDKHDSATERLNNIFGTTPITSTTDIRIRRSKEMRLSEPNSNSENEHTVQTIGKENRKILGTKVALVILERLNLDKYGRAVRGLTNVSDSTPKTTVTDLEIRRSRELKISETSSGFESEENLEKKKLVDSKGKENMKMPPRSTQTIMSPRPKRAARPKVLREISLKKKMRRSR
ncbi:putative uncharacterized protein DDB_G0281251 isoform X2 [Diorhabda carinulata]|uniref:putative uncharacterized protein DDB_G0281251 isoform X2 n=1 Tax=Diorhabda carinulata TaxID=1163345 RepID=UPI0025A16BCB|nr:putative uncharacterized protein DDB_G0281251 isoform X2 [Diorhabda carinulata]